MCDEKIERVLEQEDYTTTSLLAKDAPSIAFTALSGTMVLIRRYKETLAVMVSPKDAARLKLLKTPEFRDAFTAIEAKLQ